MRNLMDQRPARHGTATLRPYSVRRGNASLPLALRLRSSRLTESPEFDPLARDPKLARLEAALLLADEPIPARRIAEAAGLAEASEVRRLIERLKELYDAAGTAFQVEELAGGYQLLRARAITPGWRLKRTGHELRLSPAALETLAVIAYKQPITRAEVESIRGVACAEIIRMLMEKGLVRMAGRHDSLGRPQLFGTTKKFLQAFGLNTLKDLPEVEALRQPG